MNKKGKTQGMTVVLVIAVAVLAYLVLFPGASPFKPATPVTPTVDTTICPVEKVAFQPKMTKSGEASTIASTNYFIVTDKMGNQSSSASVDVPTNFNMKVLFGYGSTDYYKVVKDINTDCTGKVVPAIDLAEAAAPSTFYLKNANGQVNDVAAPQPLGADDTFEGTVYVKAGVNKYFGNPNSDCKNVAVIEYDKTYVKSVDGVNAAPMPRAFTYTNATFDGSSAFYIPKTGNGVEQNFEVTIKSTSSDPAADASPILHIYDCDNALNTKDLSLIQGVEDNDGNTLALKATTLTLQLS